MLTPNPPALNKDEIDAAVAPKHYRDLGAYSALHVAERWELNYHLGNALKYIQRAGKKPNTPEIQDLKKAAWYLARHIHLLDPENEPDPLEKNA
jgi:hypothetical protein